MVLVNVSRNVRYSDVSSGSNPWSSIDNSPMIGMIVPQQDKKHTHTFIHHQARG